MEAKTSKKNYSCDTPYQSLFDSQWECHTCLVGYSLEIAYLIEKCSTNLQTPLVVQLIAIPFPTKFRPTIIHFYVCNIPVGMCSHPISSCFR